MGSSDAINQDDCLKLTIESWRAGLCFVSGLLLRRCSELRSDAQSFT